MMSNRRISLRAAALSLAGICLAFFTGVFFLIFYRTMPNMLLSIETKYLQDQTNTLADRFDDIRYNVSATALEIGAWNECVWFVLGGNPAFIENNWAGTTPTHIFRFNFMIIKDAEGNNLFADYYDYKNDRALPPPPGLAGRLSSFAIEVVRKNQDPQPQDAAFEDFGRSGIMFYDNVPYYISVMPVMPGRVSGGAVGTIIFGLIIDDSYFHSLSDYENITFSWEQTSIYLQRESGDITRAGTRFAAASVPMADIYGNPAQLFMSGPRQIYAQGRREIFYASMLMLAMALVLVVLLYFIIHRMFLRPMERLKAGITGIADSGNKLNLPEVSRAYEFGVVGGAINDMVDRLNQSKTMQSVLDGMDADLYVTDPVNDEILFISKKMREDYGLAGDVVGETCWKVLQRGYTGRCALCPLSQPGGSFSGPVEWEEHNSVTGRYYKNTGRLIKWVDGRTVLIQHSADVTAEKEYAILLLDAKEQAEQASKAKSDFLSRMSHEMRTPMNAVIGMTHIARASQDPERKEYCLSKIDEASNHLLGVINDILDVSKIEAGKFELSYAEFNFEKMLQHVTDVINFRVEEKHQNLYITIDPEIPEYFVGDEQRLAQVLTNLLSNAVKFTPEEGKISLAIDEISHTEESSRLRVTVADNGIGISGEQQARLFTSFEQADGSVSRRFGGTGLGLAISKSIIGMMGGTIWIESELGKGARFLFELALKRGGSKREKKNLNRKELRILVVDDAPEVLEYFQVIAGALHFQCDTADGGWEALRLLDQNTGEPFDMIFVDWLMPGLDGVALTRKIKSRYADSPVVIMISSSHWDEIEGEARGAGVSGFLLKPLFPSLIEDCINTWLGMTVPAQADSYKGGEGQYFGGYTVLLAEDVEINREVVYFLLEHTGLRLESAENGAEAVEKFRKAPSDYDLILMDIHMPEVDGYEATRRIRAMDFCHAKQVPIIAMTANVFREDIENCINVGMNDHIGKPVDADELILKLKKYLLSG